MKAWIKVYIEDKIINDAIINKKTHLNRELFDVIIREACIEFDYGTPVILPSHFSHFSNYNRTVFYPRDFVEKVNFDRMVIEYCHS